MDNSSSETPHSLVKWPLRYLLAFLTLVPVGDFLLGSGLQSLLLRADFRYSRLYRGDAQADIIFLGNSRAVQAFHSPTVSKRLGKSAINLSYNGLSPESLAALLSDFVERNGPPKLVVIEASAIRFPPTALNDLKPFVPYSPGLTKIFWREHPYSSGAMQVSRLFRMNSEGLLRGLFFLRSSDQVWVQKRVIGSDLLESVEQETSYSFPSMFTTQNDEKRVQLEELNLQAYHDMAVFCRENRIDVRFVILPYLPAYRTRIDSWDETVAMIEKRIGNDLRIRDYSLALSENRQFADRQHLNATGGEALLSKMIEDRFYEISGQP